MVFKVSFTEEKPVLSCLKHAHKLAWMVPALFERIKASRLTRHGWVPLTFLSLANIKSSTFLEKVLAEFNFSSLIIKNKHFNSFFYRWKVLLITGRYLGFLLVSQPLPFRCLSVLFSNGFLTPKNLQLRVLDRTIDGFKKVIHGFELFPFKSKLAGKLHNDIRWWFTVVL